LRGSLRAATGLIGKARPERVRMTTPTATVGIRGTGWDVVCVAACVDPSAPPTGEPGGDGLYLSTWEGTVELTTPQGARLLIPNGAVGFITPNGTGFFAGGVPAVAGVNLLVAYGAVPTGGITVSESLLAPLLKAAEKNTMSEKEKEKEKENANKADGGAVERAAVTMADAFEEETGLPAGGCK